MSGGWVGRLLEQHWVRCLLAAAAFFGAAAVGASIFQACEQSRMQRAVAEYQSAGAATPRTRRLCPQNALPKEPAPPGVPPAAPPPAAPAVPGRPRTRGTGAGTGRMVRRAEASSRPPAAVEQQRWSIDASPAGAGLDGLSWWPTFSEAPVHGGRPGSRPGTRPGTRGRSGEDAGGRPSTRGRAHAMAEGNEFAQGMAARQQASGACNMEEWLAPMEKSRRRPEGAASKQQHLFGL